MTKPTVYLAGPINGKTDAECKTWRDLARLSLADGWRILDPMARDYRGREDGNVTRIVSLDLAEIREADALLVMATSPSWGTAMELVYALQATKYVVAVVGEERVSPWLRFHADLCVPHLEHGIVALNRWKAGRGR
jgi:nucleoside 2-deoxyribosyltransferase